MCRKSCIGCYSTLTKWLKDSENRVIFLFVVRNYASDEQKKLPVSDELRDAQDALDVLKKQSTFPKMTKPFISK